MLSVPNLSVSDNLFLDAALSYARRGWHVLPIHSIADGQCTCGNASCSSPGKHPATPHGVLDATTDEATIRSWWAQAPTANVGIRTGPESDLWVLGPDGPAGIQAVAELERQRGALPPTPRAVTGGGGQHVYFQWPPDGGISNRANHAGVPIDVRGQNGYVVAPPSTHISGGSYAWGDGAAELDITPAPAWLLDWARQSSNGSPQQEGSTTLVVVADDLATAPGVGEGQRHSELCSLVGRHLARGQSVVEIEPLALAWADRCEPPLPADEARRVVADLGRRHAEQPASQVSPSSVAVTDAADIEAEPLPPERPWPTLDSAALYGLAGGRLEDRVWFPSDADRR